MAIDVTRLYSEVGFAADDPEARVSRASVEVAHELDDPEARVSRAIVEVSIEVDDPEARVSRTYIEVACYTATADQLLDANPFSAQHDFGSQSIYGTSETGVMELYTEVIGQWATIRYPPPVEPVDPPPFWPTPAPPTIWGGGGGGGGGGLGGGGGSILPPGSLYADLWLVTVEAISPVEPTHLFIDGFDYYASVPQKWVTATNAKIVTPGYRSDGMLSADGPMTLISPKLTTGPAITVGFHLKRLNTSAVLTCCLAYEGSLFAYIDFNTDGSISINSDLSTAVLPLNRWRRVEILLVEDGTVTVYVNDTLALTSLLPGYGKAVNKVVWQGGTTDSFVLDHFYALTGFLDAKIGPCRVVTLDPDGNSTPQEWVPDTGNAWERVAQAAGSISASTPGDESRFSFANLPAVPDAVRGVQLNALAYTDSTGDLVLVAGTGTADAQTLTGSEVNYHYAMPTDPDTTAAWTEGGVNGLDAGVVAQ